MARRSLIGESSRAPRCGSARTPGHERAGVPRRCPVRAFRRPSWGALPGRSPRTRAGRTTRAALLLALLAPGAAAAAQGSVLEPLLAAYEAHYSPPAFLTQQANELATSALAHELARLPELSVAESVTWRDFSSVEVSLGMSASIPLYRLRTEPEAALLAEQRSAFTAFTTATATAARAEFIRDVLSLALVTDLSAAATATLTEFERYWRPPTSHADALVLRPGERELLVVHQEVAGLARFAAANATELWRRLERIHGVPATALSLPTFDELKSAILTDPPSLPVCLASGPEALAAVSLHRQRALERALASTAGVEIGLFARADYRGRFPSASDAGAATAAIGLEARIPLPGHWPASGELTGRVSPTGAEQAFRLTWPTAATTGSLGSTDDERFDDLELADSLEYLTATVTALLRSYESAASGVDAAELTLLWLVRDHMPDAVGLEAARAAARAVEDPVLAMHVVNARAELAFAEAELAGLALDLQVACGTGRLGSSQPEAPGP